MSQIKAYIKLMRVRHYIKNILVFAALASSGQLFNAGKFLDNLTAFAAFCMVSSVVYIINDIRDREKDRLHPTKCNRPIASGKVPVAGACVLAVVLLAIAILCNVLTFHISSSIVLLLYLVLNIAYSAGLKNVPLLDVTILVAGFLLRIMYGAIITGVEISNWLYLTVLTMAFYFSLGKRRNELKREGADKGTRKVLSGYSAGFLDKNMYMCLGLANVFYALWCMDGNTLSHYGGKGIIITVPIVLLITMRYSMDIEGDSDGDPVEVLLHDKILLVLCALYFSTMFVVLYFLK